MTYPGKRNPNWKGGKTIKFCKNCSKKLSRNNKSGFCRSCSKLGHKNGFYGKQHSESTRTQMCITNKKRDPKTYKGGKVPFDVLSAAMKKRWRDADSVMREKLVGQFIKAGQKFNKKSSNTNIEKFVAKILNKYRLKYIQNCPIGIKNVDFLINNYFIIECYGDYWHCNPEKYIQEYYNKSLKMTTAEKHKKDKIRIELLESKGYKVLILWENDIKTKIEITTQKILHFLNTNNETKNFWRTYNRV